MKKIICVCSACLSLNAAAQSPFTKVGEDLEEVVVKAHLLSDKGVSQSIRVLKGDALAEELQASLGETVAQSPGVRSASFGGAVGRPVIHGLGGARVKTTEDRIDSLDVSVTSTDHAVTVEPFIANQITILKGASTLLYGSGAIGGVVDTETGRIPTELPESPVSGRVEARFSDNGDAQTGALRLDGSAGDSVAWHVDAFSKDSDDYEIPGNGESDILRLEEGEADEIDPNAGTLVGSRYDVTGGAIGASWIGESGFIGASISTLDADYGLVGGHHEEEEGGEEESEEPGRIDLEQTRVDLEAQINAPFAGIDKINFRLGVNDYRHDEIEGNGEVGTEFDNQAWEARLEVSHAPLLGFDGAFGLQLGAREFSALGEEAFVPPVDSDSIGAFWVGERDFGSFSIETGVRFENVEHTPESAELDELSFDTASFSLGLVVPTSEKLDWSILFDYTERAPAIEELYSNGPHLATQTFEIGDVSLQKESAIGFTASLHYHTDVFDVRGSVYRTQFDDYIFQQNTGEFGDGLPVLAYQQGDADFTGAEIEFGFHLAEVFGGDFDLTAQLDTVSTSLDGAGTSRNLPRIPADRQGIGFAWHNDEWKAKIDFTNVSAQNDVADFELRTESYTDISMHVSRKIEIGDSTLSLFLQGRNLGDEEQRQHTSFVKDIAPAPGRRIEAGLRYQF